MPFDDTGRPVFDKSLPSIQSTSQDQRRGELYERWMAEHGQPEFQLELAHYHMVERDQVLHDIAGNAIAGSVGQVEYWVREWSKLDCQIAEAVANARAASGQAEPEAER